MFREVLAKSPDVIGANTSLVVFGDGEAIEYRKCDFSEAGTTMVKVFNDSGPDQSGTLKILVQMIPSTKLNA